jgi:hypothetical protein
LGSEEREDRRSGSREGKKGCGGEGDVTNRIRDEKGNGQSKKLSFDVFYFLYSFIYLFISKCPF